MIFRVEKTQNYTVMSNHHFKEREMSLKAKGLLSLMLSLPDDWDYSIAGLVAICKEQESAVKTALKELQRFGYLKIRKLTPDKTASGRFEYEYIVYETPQEQTDKQDIEKQEGENLPLEILSLENQGQLNTKESNTNNKYIYTQVIDYLNGKTGRRYRVTDKVRRLVNARVKEGAGFNDFVKVIDTKSAEWLHDEKMNMYLRPDTLFGNKFQGYLNQTAPTGNNPFVDILRSAT